MPLKNHSPVAAERRMDLASLFCMIGRHGPAVALAVIAVVSLLAGFILYRSVRGKRRRAGGAAAAAAESSHMSPAEEEEEVEEERDASAIGTDEEPEHSPEESTDLSDDSSPFVKEEADLIPGGLTVRHRRAPAEDRPPPSSTSITHTSAQGCYRAADASPETTESPSSHSSSVTAKVATDDTEAHRGLAEDPETDAAEQCSVERTMTPEQVDDETHTDEEVFQAKCEEEKDTIGTGDEELIQEERNFQCASNSAVCFGQDLHMSETMDDYKLQENGNTSDANSQLEEPTIQIEEDVSTGKANQEQENLPHVPCNLVCDEQETHISENGNENKLQDHENTPDTNSSLEEPIDKLEEVVSGEEVSQQEENLQCVSNSPVCFDKEPQTEETCSPMCSEQELEMSEGSDDHKLQDSPTPHANGKLEEPIIDTEDVPVSLTPYSKETEVEDEIFPPECEDSSEVDGNKQTQEKDMKDEDEEKKQEFSDDHVIVQQSGNQVSELQTNRPSSQQDLCPVTNVSVLSSQDDERSPTSEVIEDVLGEDKSNTLSEVKLNIHPLEDEQEVQDEETKESSCSPEDCRLDGITSCSGIEEHQSVGFDSSVSCLNHSAEPEKVDDDISTDTKVESFEAVSYDQQPGSEVKEDEMAPVLDHHMDPDTLSGDGPSVQEETASEKKETENVGESVKESFGHLVSQAGSTESYGKVDETVNPPIDASVWDAATFTSSVTSTEISHPDALSPSQETQNDQKQNEAADLEVTTAAAAESQTQHVPSLSFEQSLLTRSSSGFGGESGISSMTVSPDSHDALDDFHITSGNVLLPVMDCNVHCEDQAEAQISAFADDAAVCFNLEETVALASEACSLQISDKLCQDWTMDSSFAVNEDIFGRDIEDAYYRAVDQSLTTIAAASTASSTYEMKKEVEIRAPAVNREKKEETDKKEEEDFERTEISIMEATMDNNEWITDGNYQVLPWMNFSTTAFTQMPPQTDSPHTEEHNPHSAIEDVTSVDADIPTSTEVSQVNTVMEENAESSKKVLAVQPMPQNVNVKFRIHYLTHTPYQKLAITGSTEELGNWKGFIPLEKDKDGHWSTVVSLPAESHVEWKFVVLEKGEVCRWEECGNHFLDTGSVDDVIVNKWWGFL